MTVCTISLQAFWDAEARVYVATSKDCPGLILEADTRQSLRSEAELTIPGFLEASRAKAMDCKANIDVHLQIEAGDGSGSEEVDFQIPIAA